MRALSQIRPVAHRRKLTARLASLPQVELLYPESLLSPEELVESLKKQLEHREVRLRLLFAEWATPKLISLCLCHSPITAPP